MSHLNYLLTCEWFYCPSPDKKKSDRYRRVWKANITLCSSIFSLIPIIIMWPFRFMSPLIWLFFHAHKTPITFDTHTHLSACFGFKRKKCFSIRFCPSGPLLTESFWRKYSPFLPFITLSINLKCDLRGAVFCQPYHHLILLFGGEEQWTLKWVWQLEPKRFD